MDHSQENFVFNGNVARGTFQDTWRKGRPRRQLVSFVSPSCNYGWMGNSRAKRHHLVPRFYLKPFADGSGMVRVIDKQTVTDFRTGIGNAAVMRDFFTVDLDDGAPSDVLENALSQLEGKAKAVFDKLLDGSWPLGTTDRQVLAEFVAVQAAAREPSKRDMYATALNEAFDLVRQMTAATPEFLHRMASELEGREPTEEELDTYQKVLKEDVELIPHRNEWVDFFAVAHEMVRPILDRQWILTHAGTGEFVTADQPIVRWPHPEDPTFPVGMLTAESLWLPVSPTKGIRFRLPFEQDNLVHHADETMTLSWPGVELINAQVLRRAHRHVIVRPGHDWPPDDTRLRAALNG